MLVDMLPFSTIDYPGKTAAVLYFSGCNFKCSFCQNIELTKHDMAPRITIKEVLSYLKKQKGRLDAVCFTGGEPLLTKDVPMIIKAIKTMGYMVKLDTNGSTIKALKAIAPYLDYIAIDVKATPDNYDLLTKHQGSWAKVRETLAWIGKAGIANECRTTVLPEFHDWANLKLIGNIIGRSPWYLQQYREQEGVLDGRHHEKYHEKYSDKELTGLAKALKCQVRDHSDKEGRWYLYDNIAP